MTSLLTAVPKKIVAALTPVIRQIAVNTAKLAAQVTLESGAYPENLQIVDLMAFGARARLGVLASMNFFDYVPLATPYSQAANVFAETSRDPGETSMVTKVAIMCEAFWIDIHHFTPCDEMLMQAASANENTPLVFDLVTTLTPCSDGARRWARELNSPLRDRIEAPPQQVEQTVCEQALEKELITEKEMAVLLSLSPKSLGNHRRAGEVKRAIYIQNSPLGKVWYRRFESIKAIRNSTFFVSRSQGKK